MSVSPLIGRSRAAASLGVSEDADAAAARAAFLRRVAAEGFIPPEECVAAARQLASVPLPLSREQQQEEEAVQRAAVEAFAAGYWNFEPSERRAYWQTLVQHTTFSPARLRLERLEAGLELHSPRHVNPLVAELADAVKELFILDGRAEFIRRLAWLEERSDRLADYRDAARRFRTDLPDLAKLAPDFFRELMDPIVAIPAIDSAIAAAEQHNRAVQASAEVQEKLILARGSSRERQTESDWSKLGCFGPLLFLMLVKGCIALVSSEAVKQSPHDSPPSYSPPLYRPPPPPTYSPNPSFEEAVKKIEKMHEESRKRLKADFSAEEVDQFRAYERKLFAGERDLTKPKLYDHWVFLGRPGASR